MLGNGGNHKWGGTLFMPWLVFKEIWTPLKPFRIRIYREVETGQLYIKIGNRARRRLFKKASND